MRVCVCHIHTNVCFAVGATRKASFAMLDGYQTTVAGYAQKENADVFKDP